MYNGPKNEQALENVISKVKKPSWTYSWVRLRTDVQWEQWNTFIKQRFQADDQRNNIIKSFRDFCDKSEEQKEKIKQEQAKFFKLRDIKRRISELELELKQKQEELAKLKLQMV